MPRTYPPRRVKVDMRLDATDLAAVEALTEAEERTRSDMIRIVVRLGVAARKHGRGLGGRPKGGTSDA